MSLSFARFLFCAQQTEIRTRTPRGSWVSCHGRAILLTTVENDSRPNQNHGSRRIKYFFLISQRIILENHGSRLLIKPRFTRKNWQAISHFTKKKNIHESRKYPLPSSPMVGPGLRISDYSPRALVAEINVSLYLLSCGDIFSNTCRSIVIYWFK